MPNSSPPKYLLFGCAFLIATALTGLSSSLQQQDWSRLPPLAPVERELKGGETHSYRVSLKANEYLYAVVEQREIDVLIVLLGPDGKQISESDSPNDRWGTEPIVLLAPTAGDYRIDVRSPSATAPAGSYAIKIIALRDATNVDIMPEHKGCLMKAECCEGNRPPPYDARLSRNLKRRFRFFVLQEIPIAKHSLYGTSAVPMLA
jgi:hypothetical protein